MAKRLARLLLLSAALLAARAQEDGDVEAEAPPAGPTPAFLVISKARASSWPPGCPFRADAAPRARR